MEKNTLRRLQIAELMILHQFIKVCEQLNLSYFLVGGSLLGAVRHEGFIPWDDDIDVGMPRYDYDKFVLQAQGLLDKKYFLQNSDTDSEYPYYFLKIRQNNTLFLQHNLQHINIHHGIFIDIFPIDGCGTNLKAARFHLLKIRIINYLYMANALQHRNDGSTFLYKIVTSGIILIQKMIGRNNLALILGKLLTKFSVESSNYVGNLLGRAKDRELMSREIFFGLHNTRLFEGSQMNVPSLPEVYLKRLYGDYHKIPDDPYANNQHENIVIEFDS